MKKDKMMKALDKNLPSKIPNRALVDKDIKDDSTPSLFTK